MGPIWSHRSATVALTVVAATAIVLTTFFVWPGLLLPGCKAYSGPTEQANGRTYCYAIVPLLCSASPCYANFTEWGFSFHLFAQPTTLFGYLRFNITEPNGSACSGQLIGGGPTWGAGRYPTSWFAPDNESGVSVVYNSANTTLFVLR